VSASAARSSHEIAGSLAEFDFNRSSAHVARHGRFKQWSHTTIIHPELAVMANFSSIYERDPLGQHQLTLLVFGEDVHGCVRRVDPERCHISVGRGSIRFDRSSVVLEGSQYRLELCEPAVDLQASVVLRATAEASVLHNLRVGADGRFYWAVVPRLLARGSIHFRGRSLELVDAPAYRDRNWGSFAFGEVTWDWGYAIASNDAGAHSVVFTRMMDRSRTRVVEQAVLVWRGRRLLAAFRDREVTFRKSGRAAPPRLTVPAALRVCRPGSATDVPASLTVNGASSRGSIEIRFESSRMARVVVPNDGRTGVSALHEVIGCVEVVGEVEGQSIRFEGHGFIECVHG
jgi:hypothetical protein